MLIDEINKCKISLNSKKFEITQLEEQLKENNKKCDIVHYSSISLVVLSFILSPIIYLFSLLMMLPIIPAFFVLMKMEDKSSDIKEKIDNNKQCIEFNETVLENLLNRQETLEKINDIQLQMQNSTYKVPPIRLNIHKKSNIYIR